MTITNPSDAVQFPKGLFKTEIEVGLLVELFGVSVVNSGENYLIYHADTAVMTAIRQLRDKRFAEQEESKQFNNQQDTKICQLP